MLTSRTPDTQVLHPVNLSLLREAYDTEDGIYGGKMTVLYEKPTGFIVENVIPVRDHNNIAFVANPHISSSIQYTIPKRIFFNVPSAEQIPKLVDLRIRCPELDEAFGFTGTKTKFYYLFGQNAEIIEPNHSFQKSYLFDLCDPLNAINVLVIATINQWHVRPSIDDWFRETQTLINSTCERHIGGRTDPYMNNFEFYGVTQFHLPYFTIFDASKGSPEYDAYQAEVERRIQHLRQTCHEIWTNQLFQLKQRANSLDNYVAALNARAAEFEAHARSLREEAAQYENQLKQKNAQSA